MVNVFISSVYKDDELQDQGEREEEATIAGSPLDNTVAKMGEEEEGEEGVSLRNVLNSNAGSAGGFPHHAARHARR